MPEASPRRKVPGYGSALPVAVAAVTWIVSTMSRRAFERANDERTSALFAQFGHEFQRLIH